MAMTDPDAFVLFTDVRVLRSSPPALLCRVGGRSVWLPRGHISGKLWCVGDRGKLFVRRWIARDRHLIDLHGTPIVAPVALVTRPRLRPDLHLVRTEIASHAI
jgi:hypothetical protein